MAKTLGWIAVGGLSVGFVSLALAYVLAGRDLDALLDACLALVRSDDARRRHDAAVAFGLEGR